MSRLPGGNGADIAGDWDLDGTDIRDDGQINDAVGSCENCGVNIYEENADSGLCDQCEWTTHYRREPTKEGPG